MSYNKQDRGSAEAYAHYYAGMDKSMRQKIALITSFFPTEGIIADMGSGSGKGSYDLAQLYDGLSVIGIDINQSAVEHSSTTYKLPNLKFSVGDIAEAKFPEHTFDGILNSSVLHHVTSFTGFSNDKLEELLDNQTLQLKENGIIAIRDFIIPDGPQVVFLEVPNNDGQSSGNINELSTAALFESFLKNFRCNAYKDGSIPLQLCNGTTLGWQRYKTSLRLATEFVLRKDYRSDWETEIQEEYTYYTKSEFEDALTTRGLRIIVSKNIYNSWIVENRYKGKFRILDENLNDWGYPPTNYLIVGEKTNEGVRLCEESHTKLSSAKFLKTTRFKDPHGSVWDLVERKNPVLDIIPWFRKGNEIHVLFRQGYPRPICNSEYRAVGIDGCSISGFINEPLAGILQENKDLTENILQMLSERAGIEKKHIKTINQGLLILPSPGGINETVKSVFIEIENPAQITPKSTYNTGFVSRERIRAAEATQLLRSFQVGGMFDARLELHVYELLRRENISTGPWIGAGLAKANIIDKLEIKNLSDLLEHRAENNYYQVLPEDELEFLSVYEGNFSELDSKGNVLSKKAFEYAVPSKTNTLSVAVVFYCFVDGELVVGIEERHLPAAQIALQNSRLQTIPAWRIPIEIKGELATVNWIVEHAATEFGLSIAGLQTLGGTYLPSAGITPESVMVMAATVTKITQNKLYWITLKDLIIGRAKLKDGHTLISLMRFAHAVGF